MPDSMPLDHAYDALSDAVTQFHNEMLRRGIKSLPPLEWAKEFASWFSPYDFAEQYGRMVKGFGGMGSPQSRAEDVMPDTPKPSLDEMIGAVAAHASDYRDADTPHTFALRAALDTLLEHERVVAERDAARAELAAAICERDRTIEHYEHLRDTLSKATAELAEARAEIERLHAQSWQPGMPRCDFCDNGLNPDWAYCPYCSRVIDASKAAERAPPPEDAKVRQTFAPSGRVRSGKAGAAARAKSLTAEERHAIAKRAAAGRWQR